MWKVINESTRRPVTETKRVFTDSLNETGFCAAKSVVKTILFDTEQSAADFAKEMTRMASWQNKTFKAVAITPRTKGPK